MIFSVLKIVSIKTNIDQKWNIFLWLNLKVHDFVGTKVYLKLEIIIDVFVSYFIKRKNYFLEQKKLHFSF